ncbi:MAG TPA: GGDEF domain-containing protein, partial [Geobacteraceae bacterium]|nr:GGDEF domain-containing protein [Geobacteraceae bacterium]
MIHAVARKSASLFAPVAILTVAALFLPQLSSLSPPWKELLPYLPLPTILVGVLLSFQFRRGRVFLALLLLAVLYWSSNSRLFGWGTEITVVNVFGLLALLIPFNITLFMFMRERGVLTLAGRMRFVFLAIQGGAVAWFISYEEIGVARFLHGEIFHSPLPAGMTIPHPALLVLVPSFIISGTRLAIQLSPINSALVGAMTAGAAV